MSFNAAYSRPQPTVWNPLEQTDTGWRLSEQATEYAEQLATADSVEQLASQWDRENVDDPTGTTTIQRDYARKLRGRFADINTEIRSGIRDRDVLGLSEEQLADFDPDRLNDFSLDRPAQKEREFMRWLDEQLENGVLTTIDERDNQFVHRSYLKALEDSDRRLRQAGVDLDENPLRVMNQPVHQDKLELIYARNYQALEGINAEVGREVSRVLTDSLAEGANPRVAARRITDRVDSIGKTRATVLARDQIISTHAEASLERYKQQGVDEVGVEPELQISTATDQQVCEECAAIAQGGPYSIEELDNNTGLRPAIHPQCRCAIIPIVN